MTPERQRIADRIAKLLALADSTTFAAEADTARRLAGELMSVHEVSPGVKPAGEDIECRSYRPFAKGMRWEGIIADALGKLVCCNVFFGDALDCYTLVGTRFNLDILEYMLHAVNGQRIGAWTAYKARGGADSFHKFCYGFAQALDDKIDRLADVARLRAIRPVLTLWYETNVVHKSVEPTELSTGAASCAAGINAGGSASLHRGTVSAGSQKRLGNKTR